jgi:hypothetical protein
MNTITVETNQGLVDVEKLRENDILAVHRAAHNRKLYSITLKAVGLTVITDICRKDDAYKAFRLLTLLHKDPLQRITMEMANTRADTVMRLRDAIAPIVKLTKLSYVPHYWRQEV